MISSVSAVAALDAALDARPILSGGAWSKSISTSTGAGDVGEGISVGTGISVGESWRGVGRDRTSVRTVGCPCFGRKPISVGELGAGRDLTARLEGSAGRTNAISVGELGAGRDLTPASCLGGAGGTTSSSTAAASRFDAPCALSLVGMSRKARLMSSSSSSMGAGDVGDGASVGTGISVGEAGAVGLVR